MSGIAGVYHLDGSPADGRLLGRMCDAMAHRGPDRQGCWNGGSVALAHRMLCTTPESLHEHQPLFDSGHQLSLTFDGRIDNRSELQDALDNFGVSDRDPSDAKLVLSAYRAWGERCPGKLLGDFAFAIWDARLRRLFCARDILAIKPFYYHHVPGRRFLFASELHQVLLDPSVAHEPDESTIAAYLGVAVPDQECTLYRGIRRLPQAHYLIVDGSGIRCQRYWDVNPARRVRHRSDAEYAEHFMTIFQDAVRCRLRSAHRTGVSLSGGLDSSAVAAVARSITAGLAKPPPICFSMVFPGRNCDESEYIREVTRALELESLTVVPESPRPESAAEQVRRYRDFPNFPVVMVMDALYRQAQSRNVRVLLTGTGADEWLNGSDFRYADLLRRLRFADFISEARHERGPCRVVLSRVLRHGPWQFVPRAARNVMRGLWQRRRRPHPWISRHWLRRFPDSLSRPGRPVHDGPPFPTFAQQDLYTTFSGWQAHAYEMTERLAAARGIELRHPFNDRRVVEFAFAVPEEQRCRRDQYKFVLRQAMRGRLPERTRKRLEKAEFSELFVPALQLWEAPDRAACPLVSALGWIVPHQVQMKYQQMQRLYRQGDSGFHRHVWALWAVQAVETVTAECFQATARAA